MATLASRAIPTWKIPGRMNMNSPNIRDMFLPPVNRSMRILDRTFFKKVVPLSAATIFEQQNIASARNKLKSSGDLLDIHPITPIREDEGHPGKKCILLGPRIQADGEF